MKLPQILIKLSLTGIKINPPIVPIKEENGMIVGIVLRLKMINNMGAIMDAYTFPEKNNNCNGLGVRILTMINKQTQTIPEKI